MQSHNYDQLTFVRPIKKNGPTCHEILWTIYIVILVNHCGITAVSIQN